MRSCKKNKQTVWYANYKSHKERYDEMGNATGEYDIEYTKPIKAKWNIEMVMSDSEVAMFGVDAINTIAIIAMRNEIPLSDTSILWYGVDPSQDYNYRVVSVSPTLNTTKAYAERVR